MTGSSASPHYERASSLSPSRRAREVAELAAGETVDVLVVGLGVTGAGAALDAAARGLSVAAIDAHDLAFGTSRWSSKLVHGGVRYLASGDVGVAYESAVERGTLMQRTAPHLVRPLPMVLPLTSAVSRSQAALAEAGFRASDVLRAAARTGRATLPGPRRLSRPETVAFAPGLRALGLRGGLLSWDGQLVDDARLVVALSRTAAAQGARVLTYCRAEQLTGDGARVCDTRTGERFDLRARAVINATGVWSSELVADVRLRPSRGTHIVLRPDTLRLSAGLMVLVPGELNRAVFALPQPDGRIYAGLTDESVDGPVPDVPEPTESEIGFLLDVLNSVLDARVRRGDVAGAFSGLRPLLDAGSGRTADLSRRHAVITSQNGVVTVTGGKLTTYRRMAEDAVDIVVRQRGLDAGPCRTTNLRLVGAADRGQLDRVNAPKRLVRRYGVEASAVLSEAVDPALLDPIAPGTEITGAELIWGVRHEGALDEHDLLDRRTRVGLVPADRAAAVEAARAAVAAPETPQS